MEKKVLIIGGGPAGLSAGYELLRYNIKPTILEADSKYWGGISKTAKYKGYFFDIGGHRFFSKSKEIEDFWTEILGDDLLVRDRLSRIFYGGKFFYYPLKAFNALFNLGIFKSIFAVISYIKAKMFPIKNPKSFEDWVTNQFGKILYRTFFKTYTEKVWGVPCTELSADWAAQRIKGLSLFSAIKNAIFAPKPKKNGEVIKTLIEKFRYPKHGPGMMWDKAAELIISKGGSCLLNSKVVNVLHNQNKIVSVICQDEKGVHQLDGTDFISSMPLRELVLAMSPELPKEVIDAANKLNYREFLTVVLIINQEHLFDDNWIYVHDPNVKLGRIQNFKNWSPFMVADPKTSCLGLEYFCFEGDELWNSPDNELIELGKKEISQIRLAKYEDITDGCVVRQLKAYPVYDDYYKENLKVIKTYLDKFTNLQLVGRNGMHRYNNQDHSMMTGILAARNISKGNNVYDLWKVNVDAEYHEGKADESSLDDQFMNS